MLAAEGSIMLRSESPDWNRSGFWEPIWTAGGTAGSSVSKSACSVRSVRPPQPPAGAVAPGGRAVVHVSVPVKCERLWLG